MQNLHWPLVIGQHTTNKSILCCRHHVSVRQMLLSQFRDEEIKAQRAQPTCLRLASARGVENQTCTWQYTHFHSYTPSQFIKHFCTSTWTPFHVFSSLYETKKQNQRSHSTDDGLGSRSQGHTGLTRLVLFRLCPCPKGVLQCQHNSDRCNGETIYLAPPSSAVFTACPNCMTLTRDAEETFHRRLSEQKCWWGFQFCTLGAQPSV